MAISPAYGASRDWFGHADYREAVKQGHTILQIKQYLDRNRHQLRDWNVPGRGGLYDELASKANTFVGRYGGNVDTMKHSGLSGIDRARQAGLTYDQIRAQAAREGISWGSGAQSLFRQLDAGKEAQRRAEEAAQRQAAEYARIQEEMRRQAEAQEAAMMKQQRQQQVLAAEQARGGGVQFSKSKAQKKKLTTAGTAGYFGRKGLRISGLNVAQAGSGSGSFS